MKSDNHKNSFKDGLNSIQDHSALMEEDWTVLEQRLEKQEGHKRMVLWTKFLGAVAAMLLLVLAWFLFQPADLKQPKEEVVKNNKPRQEIQVPVDGETQTPAKKAVVGIQVKRAQKDEVSAQPLYLTQENELQEIDRRGAINRLGILDSSSVSNINMTLTQPDITVGLAKMTSEKPHTAVELKPIVSRLSLSLIYAPALNGVSNFSRAHVGQDVGLLLNIGLSRRWTLTTGAIYAKKPYESDFSQYNPVNKATLPYTPESIYADCRVLDIPLNVNYAVLNKGKNKVSIGTGLSSYLMLKEDYQLRYNKNDGIADYTYSIRNQNKHLLSIVNIEAKYEHHINSKLAIGIQPYMKVPISDIGYGNVKLQSLGMAINVNLSLSGNWK